LDPPRFLQILHLPIKAIRLVTDPLVDGIGYVLAHVLFPPIVNVLKSVVGDRDLPFFPKAKVEPITDTPNFAATLVGFR
jgi:hypothetical protein